MLLKFLACRADIAVIGFVIVEFIVIESRITSAARMLMTDAGCYPLLMKVFIILPDTICFVGNGRFNGCMRVFLMRTNYFG